MVTARTRTAVPQQKQKPHNTMWGKTFDKNAPWAAVGCCLISDVLQRLWDEKNVLQGFKRRV